MKNTDKQRANSSFVQRLTRREAQITRLMSAGVPPKQIAGRLGLAVPTVRMHLRHIYGKLGVFGQVGLMRWAIKRGYVTPDTSESDTSQ